MPRRKSYHHGELAEALTRAAMTQAKSGGIESITMRAIATRVGVTPAAAYHHFASKEHLLAACAEQAFAGLLDRLQAVPEHPHPTAIDRFEAMGRAYIAYALAHPAHYRMMFGAHVRVIDGLLSADSAGRRARAVLHQAAAEVAHELGGAPTAEQVVQIGWSTVVGVVALILERELAPELSPPAVHAMIDTVMRSMRVGLVGWT
jgi:AcrR family transcriptional regulator